MKVHCSLLSIVRSAWVNVQARGNVFLVMRPSVLRTRFPMWTFTNLDALPDFQAFPLTPRAALSILQAGTGKSILLGHKMSAKR